METLIAEHTGCILLPVPFLNIPRSFYDFLVFERDSKLLESLKTR